MTTVCLSFDFDATSIWVSTFKQLSPGPLSRGEYSARVGVGRVLDLLAETRVPATFFIPAHTAASHPNETRRIQEAGCEIGVHGFCHESPVGLVREQEADLLRRAIATLRGVLGPEFSPVGYRSPAVDLSSNTISLLEELHFLYDSSMSGDDFTPYRARRDDRANEERFTQGPETSIIEMPFSWELDDFPYFAFLNKPLYSGLRSTDDVFRAWKDEFDYCHTAVRDGVFILTMHPEYIGRGPRIWMLGRLIEYMKSLENVWFSTLADEARRRCTPP
jgi:peptidoglycan/xylan/chitin deacetylase (PgdA/CDA1 family)